jgi:outer membrane protein assembly factor BamB
VAGGVLFVGSYDRNVHAFDITGATGCSGTLPVTCDAIWRGATGDYIRSSPAVANGVVYQGSYDGKVHAFDAAGCGGAPTPCAPLWSAPVTPDYSSPAVANGMVFVGSTDGRLHAFGLPPA